MRSFLLTRGTILRMSCPYTFPQNGKAERIIRSTNNIILSPFLGFPSCSILGGGSSYLNRILTKTICAPSPYVALLGTEPSCEHLRVFGCACYPNMSATAPHKLAPRSIRCTFLGYSSDHKGYHCLDPSVNRIIISCLVIFDEADFSFSASSHATNDLYFLSSDDGGSAYWHPTPSRRYLIVLDVSSGSGRRTNPCI
jgi:hypothetical protein